MLGLLVIVHARRWEIVEAGWMTCTRTSGCTAASVELSSAQQ